MSDRETGIPGLSKLECYVPPENIRLIGGFGPVNSMALFGISIHQDLESILPEVMPDHKWIKDTSSVSDKKGFTGSSSPDSFMVDIRVEINPSDSVKQAVKIWDIVSTSFIMSPSKAIEVFGLDEPDQPLDPNDDVPRDYRILSIHIWPAPSKIGLDVKLRQELNTLEFVTEKASADTQGRFLHEVIRLEEDTCGDRSKLIEVAGRIKSAAIKANSAIN